MGSKAWDQMLAGPGPTTRQSITDQINQSIQDYQNALAGRSSAGSTRNWDQANAFSTQMIGAQEKQTQLKYLLNAMGNNDVGAGGAGSGGNPFDVGGSSSSSGGGAPTLNTGNRFEAGLSDAEGRLRSLLDNPDSINQSAAYKFRVNQGQEALQRSLGAKGLLNSGNRLMELTKYGQDMGSQEYDNQFGRIKDLVGGYSGSWIGDKNANTGIYNAQASAWNTAQANADRTRLGYADIAAQNSRAAMAANSGGSRSSSSAPNSGFNMNAWSKPADSWSYNTGSYDPRAGTSWYTNDQTGAQQQRYG